MRRSKFHLMLATAAIVSAPGLAHAQNLTLGDIFVNAAPSMKAIMIILLAATIAALVVTARKLTAGPLTGGSAFLSSLRAGGPLLGLLGAAGNAIGWCMALSKFGPVPINVMAPGLAEAAVLIFAGLLCGIVAVVCHWLVEARVDRTVLGG